MRIVDLREQKVEVTRRIKDRGLERFEEALESVKLIVSDVRIRGDEAIKLYERRFSKVACDYDIRVSRGEIEDAYNLVDEDFIEALKVAIDVVRSFHEEEKPRPWIKEVIKGVKAGIIPRPVDIAGIYVPGGRAPYPSSVIMTVIPAQVAGVSRIIACSPPGPDGKLNHFTLVALNEVGVREIYKVGGAQAIAAMAYGTESIPKVDIIAGPGNIYVTAAKYLVSNIVGIDVLAGPSELLVVADDSVDSRLVAIDLASQAEHDPLSQIALASTRLDVIDKVINELKPLARENSIVDEVLNKSFIAAHGDVEDIVEFVNAYAPEHLQLMVSDPSKYIEKIRSAGTILVGPKTPTALSDYCAGPSHVLPTGGSSKFRSGLSTLTFTKLIHYVEVEKPSREVYEAAKKLAEAEGFKFHAEAIRRRLNGL